MKKVTVISILFSLCPLLISFTIYHLNPWSSTNPKQETESGNHLEMNVSLHDTLTNTPVAPFSFNTLPLNIPADEIGGLETLHSEDLQAKLDAIVKSNPHYAALSNSKTLSIGIADLQDPLHAKFAAVNENNMVYAASLPKIAVLLASEEAIAQGKIQPTPEVKADMRLMIAKSNNEAASRMINRVGIKQIGEIMQDPRYNLYDKQNGGGLWVGKPYGGGGVRVGDPIKNLSHAASVFQVCKYYYMLTFGQLVSQEGSKDMLDMLVDPQLHHKFVNVLDRVAPNAKVYRKSGTWANWHADSALVWDTNRKYIVVALAEDAAGETMLRDLMLKIDTALVQTR